MSEDSVKHEPTVQDPNQAKIGSAPEVKEELSKVATSPKRNLIVIASMFLGFGVMAYNLIAPQLLSTPKKVATDQQVEKPEHVVKPAAQLVDAAPPIPQLPEPPKLVVPTPPPEPQSAPEENKIPSLPSITETTPPHLAGPSMPEPALQASAGIATPPSGGILGGDEAKKRQETKRKAPIQLGGGGGSGKISDKDMKRISTEGQQAVDFKKRGDMNYVLGQGKIIDVITETAINTDFPGEVRAIVTRDVFSESGKLVLIPKGSRVFGSFTATTTGGYGRITIQWNRIDLDTGYTLNLAGVAVDNLGRAGVQGVVDNKYTEQMTNAVLNSAFSIGIAAGLDKLVPPVASTQGAANANAATNIQNTALAIFNDQTINDENTKINKICSTVQSMINDKTSSSYTGLVQSCTTAIGTTNAQPGQRLTSIMSAVTSAATGLVTSTTAAAVPTQKQTASQQAFKDLSATMQGLMKQQTFTPTTTVDQGHQVKIYVNKDFLFPKDAVIKSKVIQ